MITRKHLSHIIEPETKPKEENRYRSIQAAKLLFKTVAVLCWIVCWITMIAGCLAGLGVVLRFLCLSFQRGWTLF